MGGGGLDYYDTQMLIPIGSEAPSASPEKVAEATKAYEDAKKAFEAIRGTPEGLKPMANGQPTQRPLRLKMVKLQNELAALTDPAVTGKVALGVREAKSVGDTEIRIRGEAEALGPIVPRGFLGLISIPDAPKIPAGQSGRLELAQWLTDAKNPLTPRVMANRVWKHLFGQGLVKSVDNFGTTGDVPSHPELLDHLASKFAKDGWSVKRLVRTIVLSRAYRLGSETVEPNAGIDPANRLVWRHNPRRLDAEEIRDASLVASGRLDLKRPEASPAKDLKVIELPNNGVLARKLGNQARASLHRSVYLPLVRGLVPTSLEVFDFAEQGMVTGDRDTTTVATQALYLLNDPFVRREALQIAEGALGRTDLDDAGRLNRIYRQTLGRPAGGNEIERARAYLAEFEDAAREVLAATPEESKPKADPVVAVVEDAKKPAPPVNPDEVIQEDAPIVEEVIRPATPKAAAWASFCQALLGSAEFRYVK